MTLYLEKRGCNIDSKLDPKKARLCDVGNYRVYTGVRTIAGYDEKELSVEFTGYRKVQGKEVIENALYSDVFRHEGSRTVRDEYECRHLNRVLELAYTKEDILNAVNDISINEYNEIKWYTSIEIEQDSGINFTPADKILEYAKQHTLDYENTADGIVLHLYTGDYTYWYYRIEQMQKNKERLIIVLKECE